ncbi:tRNA-splicing endonuclease subunit Sen34 [Trichonephila clavipes]|nr:tRNA-splicing endonuclease subunit Sen34 [Trichonephila clavipes]
MINLYFCNEKAFVWNAEDAYTLRKEYRIVGSLVGSYPIKPFQIETKWLPLQLMPEETKLLIDKGSPLPISTILLSTYEFFRRSSFTQIHKELVISSQAVADWQSYASDVLIEHIVVNTEKLGGG